MNTAQLLRHLQKRDVQLKVVDGKLKLSAPPGVLDEALLGLLRERKAGLLELLQAAAPNHESGVELQRVARTALAPCSPAQQRLWLVHQASTHRAAYNLPTALRLVGELDQTALCAALNAIVARHEALRTRFVAPAGEPLQELLAADDPAVRIELAPIDCPAAEVERAFDEHAAQEFDLQTGPLIDARLLRLSELESVLLLNMHHIVADGWSMGVLVHELCEGYRAAHEQRLAALPELDVQYIDYAAWQAQLLGQGLFARQGDYWQQRLAGIPGLLALPSDHSRPAQQSQRGASFEFQIHPDLAARLKLLAQSERASLFMLLLAAFQLQLSRIAGENDIVVGSPIANRSRPELEPLIGFFVNTLVLRTTIDPAQSFRELLRRVRDDSLQDFAHQDLPFEQLVELLKPVRSTSHSPLFQVVFTFENASSAPLVLPGLQLQPISRPGRFAKFDLTLALGETADGIGGAFEYATDLFEAATIQRWADDFVTLLGELCVAPDEMLARLGSDNRSEIEARIAVGVAGSSAEQSGTKELLPALVARHARQQPDALALVDGDASYSYAGVELAAAQLSVRLLELGVGRESRVGVCLPRSAEAVIAMLGVWKAGAAWVPLDASYPLARLQHIASDAALCCVIGGAATAELCAALARPTLFIDTAAGLEQSPGPAFVESSLLDLAPDSITKQVEQAPLYEEPSRRFDRSTEAWPEQLAYLIYTSGSTGTPKGAMIGHGSLRKLTDWYAGQTSMGPGSQHSQMAQFGFDAMVVEIWSTLAAGACLHFVDGETRLHPRQLAAWLEKKAIDIAFMPTPLAEAFLSSGVEMPSPLRWICCGGDRLKHRAPARGPRLLNCYGPTEATVISTAGEVPRHMSGELDALISIGRPLPDTRAYLLDADLHPVAPGQGGELYVAGALLGRGYHGQPGMTAERFLPDPFAAQPGARMYRTGDRARWTPGGELEFLGRIDNQVKLRGFRIELGEIESLLAQQPDVGDVAVVLCSSPAGEPCLVAYLSPAESHRVEVDTLRAALARRLPSYMVPTLLQVVEALPLLPSGKVDRGALPAPNWDQLDGDRVEPRDARERSLVEEWRAVLGVEHIGVHDDFFALGGHSLLATRLLARVNARFGTSLSLASVFNAPTVAQLAALISEASGVALHPAEITQVSREQPLPLSFAQQRLWFLAQLEPDSNAYHMPVVLRLSGELDVAAMQAAVAELAQQHEVLRARFLYVDGEPRQCFDRAPTALELVTTAADALDAAIQRFVARPFELVHDPVLRGRLFCFGTDAHVLVLVVHHIVADGWSMQLIGAELARLYGAFCAGQTQPAAASLQYGDYAHWQRRTMDAAALQHGLQYWKAQLADAPAQLDLPLDGSRLDAARGASASTALRLDPALVSQLRDLTHAHGATLFMGLLTVLKLLLSRLSGQRDICIGTPIANRDRPELEPMVGLFLGTLALRTRLEDARDFRDALIRVRDTAVAAYAHQQVPFEQIVDALKLKPDLQRHPLFQVFFNMLNLERGPDPQLPDLEVSSLTPPEQGSKFDFTLYANEHNQCIELQLHYNSALFTPARMAEMLQQYAQLLRAVLASPDQAVGEHSLCTAASAGTLPDPRQSLDDEWQGSITDWFAQRCAERPAHPAVCDAKRLLTFAELDAASNQVANWLRGQGIGSGDVVALHSVRCAAIAVGLLGVLKSGAAFMMLDAAYPSARIAACIDAAAPVAWLQIGTPSIDAGLVLLLAGRVPLQLHFDSTLNSLAGLPTDQPPVPLFGPDSLSHIAFTSGSTGVPKAIAGRHGPFTQFLPWFQQQFGIGAADRYSVLSGLAHDPMQRDVLWPLMLGGTACFPDPEKMIPGALAQWFQRTRISVANLTPAMTQVLADADPGLQLPALRRAFIVGDVLNRETVRKLAQVAPGCTPVSFYGATETQWALAWEAADAELDAAVVALGRGFPGVQLLVLNEVGALAGIGELGEIHVRSPHLAAGYWADPALTAERFLANPFVDGVASDRLYRTGDLGRYSPDGRVRGLGRADRQVSVRGFRVELGDIESTLARHAEVRQVAVLGHRQIEAGASSPLLVAFVVPRDTAAESWPRLRDSLRHHLQNTLPDYMHPARIEFLAQLPMTANGKLDQAALLSLPRSESTVESRCAMSPSSTNEKLVAKCFAEVLGLAERDCADHFFELGGHSLLAMQVVSRLRNALGWPVPVRLLFEQPTIAALAAALDAAAERNTTSPPTLAHETGVARPAIPRRDANLPIPLSFAQQRLWFLQSLDEDGHTYNMLLPLRLRGALDQLALEAALSALVTRHESLRTVFVSVSGEATQRILPAHTGLSFDCIACDESGLAAAVDSFASFPFALDQAPPVRARLFRIESELNVLAISMHHIISDGWSMGVLADELAEFYAAACEQRAPKLAELPLQFADYATWQRQHLQGAALDQQRSFWRAHLDGAPALLELPTDRARPARQSHRGDKLSVRVDASLYQQVRALCSETATTPFMLLMATWQVLLSRLSGSDDISVGFPQAGRDREELEPLIGLFASTLVLRTKPQPGLPFRDYLVQVREACLDVFAHQELPFEAMVELFQVPRSLAHTPLFQVMFNLQNFNQQNPPANQHGVPGLRFEPLARGVEAARFDLTLVLCEGEGGCFGDLEYCVDLFDRTTVERMVERYIGLLQAIVAAPDTTLALLPMLTASEQARRLAPPASAAREWRAVHESVAYWARVTPELPAVMLDDEQLDYATLDARANQLAHWLRRQGVGREQFVALHLPPAIDAVVAMLAVLKAGAVFVPIDPATPAVRLRQLLAEVSPAIVLTHSGHANALPETQAWRCLQQLQGSPDFVALPSTDPDLPIHPDQLAYAIYTSGSTGTPKAAMLTHSGWANLAQAQARLHEVDASARLLQLVSSAFDVAAGDFALALSQGACLVLTHEETRRSPELLQTVVRTARISHLQIPVALLSSLPLDGMPDLRVVIAGGESMPEATVGAWGDRLALFNAYGPTETSVMVSCTRLRGADKVSIGSAIDGVRIHVLDSQLQPVPTGVHGEIWIAGAGLGRGYLQQPALTASVFLPEIGAAAPGQRMYRSGDRGRWRFDGQLEICGRSDDQVKLRGYRIELGEVESVLRRCDGVKEAAVVLRESGSVRQLVAYVASELEAELSAIRVEAEAMLMNYMRPSLWCWLTALPKTANGKIDRKALPAPTASPAAISPEVPQTPVQQALVLIWCRLLGRTTVGLHDSFFDLGGDSILSIRAIALAAEAGWKITSKQLYEHQCIAAIAAVARPIAGAAKSQLSVSGDLVLTPIQHWFFDTVDVLPTRWNQSLLLAPSAGIDVQCAAAAIAELQAQHDALRMRVRVDGEHRRAWLAAGDERVSLQLVRIDARSEADFAQQLGLLAEGMQGEFAFDGSALFRAVWFERCDGQQRRLWLLAHHLLIDAVSWRILLADLNTLLNQSLAGSSPGLPNKTSSVLECAQRLQMHAHSDEVRANVDYWYHALSLPMPELGGCAQASDLDGDTLKVSVELDATQTQALLQQCPQAYGTGINELLLTAVAIAFEQWRGRGGLRLAMESHGRTEQFDELDVSRTVGWFTASYPFTVQLPEDTDLGVRIQAVQAQWRAVPDNGLSFGLLRYLAPDPRLCELAESVGEAPISFNYLGQFDESEGGAESQFTVAAEGTGRSRHPQQRRPHAIDIVGMVSGGRLQLDFRHGRERFDPADVQCFANAFDGSLRAIIAFCLARPALKPAQSTMSSAQAAAMVVLTLQPHGAQRGLFCVHPAGGSIDCYRPLAAALGTEQAVYGLQAPSLTGAGPLLHSFGDMAALYVRALRHVQPQGPYRLLGWSQGGTIAYEMACQLQEQGETVEALFMVDSGQCKQMLREPERGDECVDLLEFLQQEGFVQTASNEAVTDAERFEALVAQAQRQGLLPEGMGAAQVRNILATHRAISRATAEYLPRAYDGRVVLLRAEDEHLFGHLGERLGWATELCSNWQTLESPGDHFSCVRAPQVQTLAATLLALLETPSVVQSAISSTPRCENA